MSPATSTDTRERLLQAGLQVFAANGFEQGTIRAITHHADANQAAVNYHFGNKAALYEAVVHRALERALKPLEMDADQRQGRSEVVRALVTDIVTGALRGQSPATHLRIITAEILRPTGTLQSVVGDAMSVRTPHLARRVQAMADADAESDGRAKSSPLLAHWLLGSCLVALQLAPKAAYGDGPEAIMHQDELVGRLSGLLLDGLNGMAAA